MVVLEARSPSAGVFDRAEIDRVRADRERAAPVSALSRSTSLRPFEQEGARDMGAVGEPVEDVARAAPRLSSR